MRAGDAHLSGRGNQKEQRLGSWEGEKTGVSGLGQCLRVTEVGYCEGRVEVITEKKR